MNSEENKNLIVLIVVLVIVGLLSLFYNLYTKNKDKEPTDNKSIILVNDYNRFFTVSSCASKYINYLSANSIDNVMIVLSSEYKEEYNIDKQNMYNYINKVEGNQVFSARKMFEENIGNNIYKYYVYGILQEDTLNKISVRRDYYLIVILDENNMTFAIEPYDGKIFNGSDIK